VSHILEAGDLLRELKFSSSRSSGPGGQNVNKVNTKVTLKWDVVNSILLTAEQKELLITKLNTRLTNDGILLLTSQDKRSQLENKEAAISKLNLILIKAFTPKKARKKTKPTKSSSRKRIETKKRTGEKKQWRKKLD
jgi:ribosome-associated protein